MVLTEQKTILGNQAPAQLQGCCLPVWSCPPHAGEPLLVCDSHRKLSFQPGPNPTARLRTAGQLPVPSPTLCSPQLCNSMRTVALPKQGKLASKIKPNQLPPTVSVWTLPRENKRESGNCSPFQHSQLNIHNIHMLPSRTSEALGSSKLFSRVCTSLPSKNLNTSAHL